jgi:hypothetical protein
MGGHLLKFYVKLEENLVLNPGAHYFIICRIRETLGKIIIHLLVIGDNLFDSGLVNYRSNRNILITRSQILDVLLHLMVLVDLDTLIKQFLADPDLLQNLDRAFFQYLINSRKQFATVFRVFFLVIIILPTFDL